jgi:sterol desaturase/sphingolipid hydroxylase (fatty acid hydroxylase superfamily)
MITDSPSCVANERTADAMRVKVRRLILALVVFGSIIGVIIGLDHLLHPDEAASAAAQEARKRVAAGEFLQIPPAGLVAIATKAAKILLLPLALIGAMLIIELVAGPRDRAAKNYRLIWKTQFTFITTATAVSYLAGYSGLISNDPLIQIEAGSDVFSMLAVTLPLFVLALFVADFCLYWVHRALHAVPSLWRFHRVHHSPTDLCILENVVHPVEVVLRWLLIIIPTSYLIRVDTGDLLLLGAIVAALIQLQHMNVPVNLGRFGGLLVDNRYHFIHHSRSPADFNSNYAGMFPVLDMLFGTYRRPKPGPLPPTGLAHHGAPTTFRHYLLAKWPPNEESS